MKTRYFLLGAMSLLALPMAAQETYQDTKLIGNELNGTARYVGMGGAMEALGADLSTMQTNPAGIGLFRRSQIAASGGLSIQSDASTEKYGISLNKGNTTNASFDQIGFVWAHRTGRNSFLNLGFNYHKSRNFDQILNAAGRLNNASLGKLSSMKYNSGLGDEAWSGVDATYRDMLETTDASGNKVLPFYNGSEYAFGQWQHGYIGEYDFNISGNIHDRVYLGLTLGIHDVNYRSNKYYAENLNDATIVGSDNWEQLKIDGTGVDVKFGAIFRPVQDSPFRIGLYINTPVFYDLTQRNAFDAQLITGNNQPIIIDNKSLSGGNSADYDFKVYTPWKFGISFGHTIDDVVALGLTYEYSKYSAIDNRVNDGGYYDWYGDYYDDSSSDDNMNNDTELNLRSVHTVKFGIEVNPVKGFSIRAGYNFVSPVFKSNAYRDVSIQSPGVAYSTSADYTNWKATNRATFGLGYNYKNFFADMAYQYSQTNGTFHPFLNYYNNADYSPSEYDNIAESSKVSFKRSQLLFTVGYRF